MSETVPTAAIRDLLQKFVNAPTWSESREIVTQYAEEFRNDIADRDFAAWIAEEEVAEEQADLQTLIWYREVLQACWTDGIDMTFDDLPEPRPLNKALPAFVNAHTLDALFELIHSFPEIMSEVATKAIQELIRLARTEAYEQIAMEFMSRLSLIEAIKTPDQPISEDLVTLLEEWIKTDTLEQSKEMLEANANHLLSDEALGALNKLLIRSRGEDEVKTLVLWEHTVILKRARTESITKIYAEVLRPLRVERALQVISVELHDAIRAFMKAKTSIGLRKKTEQYPVLLTQQATTGIATLLEQMRIEGQEHDILFTSIERRLALLKEIIEDEQDSIWEELDALLQADTPGELQQAIAQHHSLLEESTLNKLIALTTNAEQRLGPAMTQRLRLRINEIQRIQRQHKQASNDTSLNRPSPYDGLQISETHADRGSMVSNYNQGIINLTNTYNENNTLPKKQWKRPTIQTLDKTFVGRQKDLDKLRKYLTGDDSKKITILLGMAGIGKTYLACQMAKELDTHFPRGIIWIDLGPQITDEVTAQIPLRKLASSAFGGQFPSGQLDPDQVRAWLQTKTLKRLLVIFDDVWPLAPMSFLRRALPPNTICLVTTRYRTLAYKLGGPQVVHLDRLTPPDGLALLEDEDRLNCQGEADYRSELEQLVELLGGHALALDIIAARIQKPSWAGIYLKDLQSGIDRWTLDGLKLSEKPDENLEKSLALSYNRMSPEEQHRFRALGIFAVGTPITPEAAAAVWGINDQNALLYLRELANLSLLTEIEESNTAIYRQHSLLNVYAHALLGKSGELTNVSWAHATYYSQMAEHAEQATPKKYQLLDQHIQNLLIALQWSVDNEHTLFATLLARSCQFLRFRGHLPLLETYIPKALAVGAETGNEIQQGYLLRHLGEMKLLSGYLDQARTHYEAALPLFQARKDSLNEANVLLGLGRLEYHLHNLDSACVHYEAALPLVRAVNNQRGEANLLMGLGMIEDDRGNLTQARIYFETALPLYRSVQDNVGEASLLLQLSGMEIQMEHFDQARLYLNTALSFVRAEHIVQNEAAILFQLGNLEMRLEHLDQAHIHFNAALSLFHSIYAHSNEASVLKQLGDLGCRLSNFKEAQTYYESALPLLRAVYNQREEIDVLMKLSILELRQGQIDKAITHVDAILPLISALGDQQGDAGLLGLLGILEGLFSNLEKIRTYHDAALRLFDRTRPHFTAALHLFHTRHNKQGEATLLRAWGELESQSGNLDQARALFDTALSLFRTEHNLQGEADTQESLGDLETKQGNINQARTHYTTALSLSHTEGKYGGEASLLESLGDLECQEGNLEKARDYFDAALSLCRARGNRLSEANLFTKLGVLESRLGNFEKARTHFEASLLLFRVDGFISGEANACKNLADLFLAREDWKQARLYYEQALPLFITTTDVEGQSSTLMYLGCALFVLGEHGQGMQYVRQAAEMFYAVQDDKGSHRAEWYLAQMRVQLDQHGTTIVISPSLNDELLKAFIDTDSFEALLQLVRRNPRLLTDEWFTMIEFIIVTEKGETHQRAFSERLSGLRHVKRTIEQENPLYLETVLVLDDFVNSDWVKRRQLLNEHSNLLVSESVEPTLDKALKAHAEIDKDLFDKIKQLRALLLHCRRWGINVGWHFALNMHLGDDIPIPGEHEPEIMQVASLLSHQYENKMVLEQAIKIMQTILSKDTSGMFCAALLCDLADALKNLPDGHPLRQFDQMEAYYLEALPRYQITNRRVSAAYIQCSLGNLYFEQEQNDKAISLLQEAAQSLRAGEHTTSSVRVLLAYARALNILGLTKETLEVYATAISQRPDLPLLFYNRAEVLIYTRRLEDAEADLAHAIELEGNKNNPYLWLRRAQLAIAQGNNLQADQMLMELSERDPYRDVTFLQAQSAWLKKEINVAQERLQHAFNKTNAADLAIMRRDMKRLLDEYPELTVEPQ